MERWAEGMGAVAHHPEPLRRRAAVLNVGGDPEGIPGVARAVHRSAPVPSVLLVHPDPASWLQALPEGAADVTTADSAQAARAYLAGTAFDAVLVGPGVEGAEAIGALRDLLGLSTPIEAAPISASMSVAALEKPGKAKLPSA